MTCDRCQVQYFGKTSQALKKRLYGHRILNKHFFGPCQNRLKIQVIDHDQTYDPECLAVIEEFWIKKLKILLPDGLNVTDELFGIMIC